MIVHLNRFYWKADVKAKAKICRPVVFPDKFDILPFTDSKLRASTTEVRRMIEENKQKELAQINLRMSINKTCTNPIETKYIPEAKIYQSLTSNLECSSISGAKDIRDEKLENSHIKKETGNRDNIELNAEIKPDNILIDDVSKSSGTRGFIKDYHLSDVIDRISTSGYYEPISIITHIGRSSDAGHYIGWSRCSDGKWNKFDDDIVSNVSDGYVKDLGRSNTDSHIPYIIFLRRI